MSELTCPDCNGAGTMTALVNRTSGCKEENVVCAVCRGSGGLSDEQFQALELGRKAYLERVARGESLREAAVKIGCLPVALSDFEHGRGPAPEGA